MKKILFIPIILFTQLFAQNGIYKTYDDYINGDMEEFHEYVTWITAGVKTTLTFSTEGKKFKMRCEDFWGFTYKGVLFRNTVKYPTPVRLISSDKIFYYENGVAHLRMLRDNVQEGSYFQGSSCYFSDNIESAIIALPEYYSAFTEKDIAAYRDSHSQYKVLFDCIGKWYEYTTVRRCVETFQSSE